MKRKHKDREFRNRLILTKVEFMKVYKNNKYIFLNDWVTNYCTDIIKLHRQLTNYAAYEILDYIYDHKGLVNDFVALGNSTMYVNIDITPKKLNEMIKKIKRMVEKYEE